MTEVWMSYQITPWCASRVYTSSVVSLRLLQSGRGVCIHTHFTTKPWRKSPLEQAQVYANEQGLPKPCTGHILTYIYIHHLWQISQGWAFVISPECISQSTHMDSFLAPPLLAKEGSMDQQEEHLMVFPQWGAPSSCSSLKPSHCCPDQSRCSGKRWACLRSPPTRQVQPSLWS